MKYWIVSFVVLFLVRCTSNEIKIAENGSEEVNVFKIEKSLNKKIEIFFSNILKDSLKSKRQLVSSEKLPPQVLMFTNENRREVNSISNVLYILDYKDLKSASFAFEDLVNKLFFFKTDKSKLSSDELKEIDIINMRAKPGRFIFSYDNYIYILEETCQSSPKGGAWKEFENDFVSVFDFNNQTFSFLNADCGDYGYKFDVKIFK